MQNKSDKQVSFNEIELSLENIDSNALVEELNGQTEDSDSVVRKTAQLEVIEATQVISSSRYMPSQEQENVMYAAAIIVFGVLVVVSLYAGLVFI